MNKDRHQSVILSPKSTNQSIKLSEGTSLVTLENSKSKVKTRASEEPHTNLWSGSEKSKTRIVNLPIKRSFKCDRPTMLRCALTTLCFRGGEVSGVWVVGVKRSILNMNAMLCFHYSIHVYYALLSLYSIHV